MSCIDNFFFLQSMLRIVVRLWKKSVGTHGKDTKARLVTVSAAFARCVRDPSAYLCLSASTAPKEARQSVWKDAAGEQRSARPVGSSRNNDHQNEPLKSLLSNKNLAIQSCDFT